MKEEWNALWLGDGETKPAPDAVRIPCFGGLPMLAVNPPFSTTDPERVARWVRNGPKVPSANEWRPRGSTD